MASKFASTKAQREQQAALIRVYRALVQHPKGVEVHSLLLTLHLPRTSATNTLALLNKLCAYGFATVSTQNGVKLYAELNPEKSQGEATKSILKTLRTHGTKISTGQIIANAERVGIRMDFPTCNEILQLLILAGLVTHIGSRWRAVRQAGDSAFAADTTSVSETPTTDPAPRPLARELLDLAFGSDELRAKVSQAGADLKTKVQASETKKEIMPTRPAIMSASELSADEVTRILDSVDSTTLVNALARNKRRSFVVDQCAGITDDELRWLLAQRTK